MTDLASILDDATSALEAASVIPGPAGDVAKILAAAAGIAAKLASDGRSVEEIVAHIERADDIGPKVAAGDVAAEAVVEERFGAPGAAAAAGGTHVGDTELQPAGNPGGPEPGAPHSTRGAS